MRPGCRRTPPFAPAPIQPRIRELTPGTIRARPWRANKPSLHDVTCSRRARSPRTVAPGGTTPAMAAGIRLFSNGRSRSSIPRGKGRGGLWWSLSGSNRRPPACKAGALPAELRPHPCRTSGLCLVETAQCAASMTPLDDASWPAAPARRRTRRRIHANQPPSRHDPRRQ